MGALTKTIVQECNKKSDELMRILENNIINFEPQSSL